MPRRARIKVQGKRTEATRRRPNRRDYAAASKEKGYLTADVNSKSHLQVQGPYRKGDNSRKKSAFLNLIFLNNTKQIWISQLLGFEPQKLWLKRSRKVAIFYMEMGSFLHKEG